MKTGITDRLIKLTDRHVEITDGDIIAVVVGYNEKLRIPYFLEYYRSLGVTKFIYVDNASTDGSVEYLQQQADVLLYGAPGSYLESRAGLDWSKAILDKYCVGRWTLIVDVDELLVYPGVEAFTLPDLIGYLEKVSAQGLMTIMIDTYPAGPLRDIKYQERVPFIEACCFFDRDGYFVQGVRQFPSLEVRGGPRLRCFFEAQPDIPAPPLKKVPLVKWDANLLFTSSTHFLSPPIRLLDISGALLHFKFFHDFAEHAVSEIARGQRWNSGVQYKLYLKPFEENPGFSMLYDHSEEYVGSAQLVRLGLIRTSWRFREYLNSIAETEDKREEAERIFDASKSLPPLEVKDVLALWPGIVEVGKGFPAARMQQREIVSRVIDWVGQDVRSPETRYPSKRSREGNLDGISFSEIFGWARDPNDSDNRLEIEIRIDGEAFATVVANKKRRDLQDVGFGSGEYGFSLPLPEVIWDGRDHKISACFRDNGKHLRQSPIRVSRSDLKFAALDELRINVRRLRNVLS
ncbi:MAG: glycosyltransferase family 2 protein [Parvibaculum sp.]|uniref:glycosyltransferase family 2 protein n=1 Tax=Parvibaculum sp. TaxID=2024848 RepID=UPI0032EAD882